MIRHLRGLFWTLTLCHLSLPWLAMADQAPRNVAPPGAKKSTETKSLEMGSQVLQTDRPVDSMNIYLQGFHPLKDDPSHQMEAHHFCRKVNEDFTQCALFDGNSKEANLNGIEYIISEKLFKQLPKEEKKYWHPHNYEILSGQLVAPGLPDVAERELMEKTMNSYGKTWHVWMSGAEGIKGDKLPLGDAKLAWSFNSDGEIRPELIEARDRKLDMKTSEIRNKRKELGKMARPQEGEDALKGKFRPQKLGLNQESSRFGGGKNR